MILLIFSGNFIAKNTRLFVYVTPHFSNNVNNTNNQSIQRKTGYHTTFQV